MRVLDAFAVRNYALIKLLPYLNPGYLNIRMLKGGVDIYEAIPWPT